MSSFVDLEKCVQANISPQNNDIRIQAENHLKELKKKYPQQFFEGLSQLIMKSKDCNVRSFSAVLLKQNLRIFDETFFKMPANSQSNIKKLLLSCIENEKNQNVTVQIAEAISHLTCLILQNSNTKWNELIPFLLNICKSPDINRRASFYICIDKLALNCMDIMRCHAGFMEKLRDILTIGLEDKNVTVRERALSAVVALLCSLNEENELLFFSNIVPLLFKNIDVSNNSNNDLIICKTCERLQMLAENQPNFFVSSMNPIIKCLVSVTKCNNLEWDTRRLSMNLLITLLDYNSHQIQNNNLCDIATKIIPLVFDFLSTFNEGLEWNSPADDTEQVNYIFANEILPIVVSIFGPDIFLNIIQKPVFDIGFADNSPWKKKLIALKTVEVTLEGCVEHYEYKLQNIIGSIIKFLSPTNSKYVKYAALLLIKQLSVIFGEDKQIFLIPYHKPIMSTICKMLSNGNAQNEHRCVLIAICEAISHFVYMDDSENENDLITLKYASNILHGLYNLLKCNDHLIQSHALKAISVTISVIQEKGFTNEFYKNIMKYCINLLQQIFGKNLKDITGELRGRCMECIGQMLVVTDIDICRTDAHNIMKYLLPFQKTEQENAASESYTYMLSLFASCAEALTNEFTPYLQHVIPPLLISAAKQSMSINKDLNNNNDDDKKEMDNNNNNNMLVTEIGGFQIQVNTAKFNERSTAVKQFPRYAVCMEGELLQFVKPIAKALQPIIKTRALSSQARRHAIETFCPLVHCLRCGLQSKNVKSEEVNKWVTEFAEELLNPLIDGMNISDEVDEFSMICKTIQDLLDDIDIKLFKNASIISDITEQIQTAINERQERRKLNEEKSIDLIDEEVEIDVEADLADTVVDLVSKLVCKFGDKYIQIFDKFVGKQCIDLLSIETNEDDIILSLSMLTEIIRYGTGNLSNKYVQYILNISQQYLSTGDNLSSPVLQSIAYAIGIIAIKKGLNTNNIGKWLNLLENNIIKKPNARHEDNVSATENAISAIGKICKTYENVNNNQIMNWIQMLPLIHDCEEREFCNEYLLQILKQTSLLKGIVESNNSQMINKLTHIIAVAILNKDKQEKEFKELFLHIKSKCNANIIQQSMNNLSNDLQSAFK